MPPFPIRLALLFFFGSTLLAAAEYSTLAYPDEHGRLEYGSYANRGETSLDNRLPDFSMCGYRGGGIALPDNIPVTHTIEASDEDQRALIQSAIDELSNSPINSDGYRGSILLKAGLHKTSGPINVSAVGIVLRGEGQNTALNGGTEIVATLREQHNPIRFVGTSSASTGPAIDILDDYLGTGSSRLKLESTESLEPGQRIYIEHTPNELWIDTLTVRQWGWTTSSYTIRYERRVVAIDENFITIDSPLVQPIRQIYGGGRVRTYSPTGRIRNCGIENLSITSEYSGDEDEAHGWSAVYFENTENCWIRKVTAKHFGYGCVRLNKAYFSTIEDCASLDPKSQTTGGRKYSFTIDDGSFNLFQRCYTRGGRHDAVTGSRVPGPNVFLDIFGDNNNADSGNHHRYATGTLFDNIHVNSVGSRNGLNVENRQDSGTGHGWSGAQTVFWNCKAQGFVCDAPQTAMNFNIGYDGEEREGSWAAEEPRGFWEVGDPFMFPRSLYLTQLKDRLGLDSVLNIATLSQLSGNLWDELGEWQGYGSIEDGSESAAGMILPNWLADRGLSSTTEIIPEFKMTAGLVYLTGADLRTIADLEPISISHPPLATKLPQSLNLSFQTRILPSDYEISLQSSSNLISWIQVDASDWILLGETNNEDGTRQSSWQILDTNNLPHFFRLSGKSK
jgi:hypothetical protein